MRTAKGMILVGSRSYRIVRVARAQYEAVRIADDITVGSFVTEPRLTIINTAIELNAMREVAKAALRAGTVHSKS